MEYKIEGDGQQADNHARYTIIYELFAAHAVNDKHGDNGCKRIYHAHKHLSEERIFKTGVLKYAWTVVKNGVDTHKLPQNGNGRTYNNGLKNARFQQLFPLRFHLPGDGRARVGHLSGHSFGRSINFRKDVLCPAFLLFDDEPARAFGYEKDDGEEEQCRQRLHSQHGTPHLGNEKRLQKARTV